MNFGPQVCRLLKLYILKTCAHKFSCPVHCEKKKDRLFSIFPFTFCPYHRRIKLSFNYESIGSKHKVHAMDQYRKHNVKWVDWEGSQDQFMLYWRKTKCQHYLSASGYWFISIEGGIANKHLKQYGTQRPPA